MKIKVENLLDKILDKFNLKRVSKEEKGKVLKFDTSVENIKEEKKDEGEKTRKGSLEIEVKKENNKIKKQGTKILASMILLLMLSLSLGLKDGILNYDNSFNEKNVSSIATAASVDNTNLENISNTESNVIATKATEKVVTKKTEEKLVFCKPLDGEIQKMYSTDKVIYSKTLSQWKTHDGLDISATSSTEVKAIEKGVVEEIYDDSFYGKTIVIEHISGYRSQYSNLDSDVYVSLGESVIKGQKIAKVGNTAVGEYLDSSHLHFMLFLNDKSINPTYLYD